MLDKLDKWISGYACGVGDQVQAGNLQAQVSYAHVEYEGGAYFFAEGFQYPWQMDIRNSMDVGYVGLVADYKYTTLKVDVLSLPYIRGEVSWNVGDSLLFASAGLGRGNIPIANMKWELDDTTAYIHELEGYWDSPVLNRDFSLGSKFRKNLVELNVIKGESRPDIGGRTGYVFSDTSDIWIYGFKYSYSGKQNQLSLNLLYMDADITVEGLNREELDQNVYDEKRFFYLPVQASLFFAMLDYSRYRQQSETRNDKYSLRLAYANLDLNIPYISWKEGRFYPTLAPNQILDNSLVKLISLGVYNQNYRIYGEGNMPVWLAGGDYEWNFGGRGWHIKPNAGLHLFYVDAALDLGRCIEEKSFTRIKATVDTLSWNLRATGMFLSMGSKLESPRRGFVFEVNVGQMLPVYYREEHFNLARESGPVLDENGNPVDGAEVKESVMHPTLTGRGDAESYRLFKNGFLVTASIGLKL